MLGASIWPVRDERGALSEADGAAKGESLCISEFGPSATSLIVSRRGKRPARLTRRVP